MSVDNMAALGARDDLLWIVDNWGQLVARLRPGGGNALTGMPGGSGGKSRPPIDLHVSDLMAEIEWNVARHYANALIDETNPEDEPITTSHMPMLLAQVARRFGHFTHGDERTALQFCDDAADYRDRVRKVLERPAPPVYVGPCQHKGEDGAGCEGELYLREGRTDGTCRTCGTAFTLADQQEWLAQELEARLMTASEIVSALVVLDTPTPIGTVKSWIGRKRLVEAVPHSGLYRLADARALAKRRKVG